MTSTQAGQLIGKSSRTVLRLMDAGLLVSAGQLSGVNGPYLFRRSDIQAYLDSRAARAAS
ncbi:MAG: helix-turn-helix domain-containing protein [Rhodococcus sp. (in: high G+C Gram-positive bacteria)]